MNRYVARKLKIVLIIVVAAALIGGGIWAVRSYVDSRTVVKETEKAPIIDKTVTITSETIRDGLSDIGELATEEYYFTQVETFEKSKAIKSFTIPFTTSSYIVSYDGVIKAGIDFTQIEVDKDELKKLIIVSIPKAEILSCEIDYDSFKLYDEKNSIFNRVTVTEMNETLKQLTEDAKTRAVDKGLIGRADNNAHDIIRNFLRGSFDLQGYSLKVVTLE